MTDREPCRTCGSAVRIRRESSGERSQSQEQDEVIKTRVCTNASCPTNSRERPQDAIV